MTATREKIREHIGKHPKATVRGIMAAVGVSSTSVVAHHLRALKYEKKSDADLITENEALRKQVKALKATLAKVRAAILETTL